jgi:hypothetical protein
MHWRMNFKLVFTHHGNDVFEVLKPLLETIDLTFSTGGKAAISWSMPCEGTINRDIKEYLMHNEVALKTVRTVFLEMEALNLLLKYLYSIQRKRKYVNLIFMMIFLKLRCKSLFRQAWT